MTDKHKEIQELIDLARASKKITMTQPEYTKKECFLTGMELVIDLLENPEHLTELKEILS